MASAWKNISFSLIFFSPSLSLSLSSHFPFFSNPCSDLEIHCSTEEDKATLPTTILWPRDLQNTIYGADKIKDTDIFPLQNLSLYIFI